MIDKLRLPKSYKILGSKYEISSYSFFSDVYIYGYQCGSKRNLLKLANELMK